MAEANATFYQELKDAVQGKSAESALTTKVAWMSFEETPRQKEK